tara:strand:- start:2869 stop:3180 length:312 start_codon:yes stop_codon:yes gene_type:complete
MFLPFWKKYLFRYRQPSNLCRQDIIKSCNINVYPFIDIPLISVLESIGLIAENKRAFMELCGLSADRNHIQKSADLIRSPIFDNYENCNSYYSGGANITSIPR